jgi:hypothetical protein
MKAKPQIKSFEEFLTKIKDVTEPNQTGICKNIKTCKLNRFYIHGKTNEEMYKRYLKHSDWFDTK